MSKNNLSQLHTSYFCLLSPVSRILSPVSRLLRLAWKNIWRNKLRSGVILFAIALGLFAGIFIAAFANGMVNQLIEDTLNIEITHLQINQEAFLDRGELQDGFSEEPFASQVRAIPHVVGVSPRLIINASASTSHNMGNVQLIGIDPEQEKSVSALYQTITDSLGTYFENDAPNSIIVGGKFAEKFKVKLGNKVVLSFADNMGEPFSAAFRVCGIYHSNNSGVDEIKIYTRINNLRELCPLPQDSIHELAVRLENNSDTLCNSVKAKIEAMLHPGEVVRSWKEINPVIGMYNGFMQTMFTMVIVIILIALGFGIVNTVLMSVMERKRELWMLMAIGMNRRKVMALIISESTILTLLGGLLGIFLGVFTIFLTGKTGIDMSNSLSSYSVIGVSALVFPTISVQQCMQIIVMVIVTGVVAAIYPARVACRRHEND